MIEITQEWKPKSETVKYMRSPGTPRKLTVEEGQTIELVYHSEICGVFKDGPCTCQAIRHSISCVDKAPE